MTIPFVRCLHNFIHEKDVPSFMAASASGCSLGCNLVGTSSECPTTCMNHVSYVLEDDTARTTTAVACGIFGAFGILETLRCAEGIFTARSWIGKGACLCITAFCATTTATALIASKVFASYPSGNQ